jgi:hypothetical protein
MEILNLQGTLTVIIALGTLSSQLLTSTGFLNVYILRNNVVKYTLD